MPNVLRGERALTLKCSIQAIFFKKINASLVIQYNLVVLSKVSYHYPRICSTFWVHSCTINSKIVFRWRQQLSIMESESISSIDCCIPKDRLLNVGDDQYNTSALLTTLSAHVYLIMSACLFYILLKNGSVILWARCKQSGPKTFWATSPVGLLEWKITCPKKKSLVQIINNSLGQFEL
jgi:hypothetical protein